MKMILRTNKYFFISLVTLLAHSEFSFGNKSSSINFNNAANVISDVPDTNFRISDTALARDCEKSIL